MYKTILVPLDGSKRAERILIHVERLAHCFGARVVFVQVVRSPRAIMSGEAAEIVLYQQELEQLTNQAKTYLAALKGEFREKGIDGRTYVAHGPVVKTIIDTAEREAVDLIAMTSHGWSGLARVFYGSVAAGVLNQAARPLLIVRSRGSS
ncbi:MAG: universal stress protein [Pseudomonadota bacterium]